MVNVDNGQSDHCRQLVKCEGAWRDVKGRSWYVEACREHAPKASSA
jgi:hypothetical protein